MSMIIRNCIYYWINVLPYDRDKFRTSFLQVTNLFLPGIEQLPICFWMKAMNCSGYRTHNPRPRVLRCIKALTLIVINISFCSLADVFPFKSCAFIVYWHRHKASWHANLQQTNKKKLFFFNYCLVSNSNNPKGKETNEIS